MLNSIEETMGRGGGGGGGKRATNTSIFPCFVIKYNFATLNDLH